MERALSLISNGQCTHFSDLIEEMENDFTKKNNTEMTMRRFISTTDPGEIIKHIVDPIAFEVEVFTAEYKLTMARIEKECFDGFKTEVAHTSTEFIKYIEQFQDVFTDSRDVKLSR